MIAFIRKNPFVFFLLSVIFLFLITSRLYLLANIPGSLPHDELVYTAQARSFVRTGRTIDGLEPWYALSPVHSAYAEWPAMLLTPGFAIFKDPLVAAHITSALMGITLPFLLGWLTYYLWQEKWVSISLILLTAVSPLHWQLSRVGYDAWYSYWWYVVGALVLIAPYVSMRLSRWSSLLALIPLTIGFFQYQGFKLLMFPWIVFIVSLYTVNNSAQDLSRIVGMLFSKKTSSSSKKISSLVLKVVHNYAPQLVVVFLTLVLTMFYGLILLPSQGVGSRLSMTVFSDVELHQVFEDQVNTERRLSLASPFASIMSNKVASLSEFLLRRLTGAFDLRSLFIAQDASVSGFAVWSHGLFYWIDGVAIMLGLVYLFSSKNRASGVLKLGAILVLSTPALINTQSEWYMLRMVLSYSLVLWLAAWMIKLIGSSRLLVSTIMCLYILSVFNFSYHYFYRYPVMSLDWSNFDKRVIAEYIWRVQEAVGTDTPIYIYNSEIEAVFFALITYAQSNDIVDQVDRRAMTDGGVDSYQLGSIRIEQACWDGVLPEEGIVIVQNSQPCEGVSHPTSWITIPAVMDSGERHAVYGDLLCSDYALSNFVHLQSAKSLGLPELSNEAFCQTWLTDLSNY